MDTVNVIHRFSYRDICDKLFKNKYISVIALLM